MLFLRRYVQGIIQHKLIIAVVVASAIGVSLTSRDLFLTPVAAATMAGIAVVLLQRLWRSEQWSDWKHLRTAQLLSLVAVPVAFSTGLSVDSDHLFRQAFNSQLPAGVRDLQIDASLLNPAGKRTVLMRFAADVGTLSDLLGRSPFQVDAQMQEAWAAEESWNNIAHQAFGDFARFGGTAWTPISPMSVPQFREWQREEGGVRLSTRVLWDAETSVAYVLYTVR